MSLVLKTNNVLALAAGSFTTVTASDTVVTGLREVAFAVASLASDPIAAAATATVVVPDQSTGSGTITIKSWTSTQTAGTTFGKQVNWIAFGK